MTSLINYRSGADTEAPVPDSNRLNIITVNFYDLGKVSTGSKFVHGRCVIERQICWICSSYPRCCPAHQSSFVDMHVPSLKQFIINRFFIAFINFTSRDFFEKFQQLARCRSSFFDHSLELEERFDNVKDVELL